MARILFVYARESSFVAIDRDCLAERHEVRDWRQASAAVNVAALAREVRRADAVFGWFASWHTFWPVTLARMLGRPAVVVTGGYDTARLPQIGYGLQQRRLMGAVSRRVMRRATRLIVNSHYSMQELGEHAGIDPGQVRVVHHGVPDPFGELDGRERERLALTVGAVDARNLERKGLRPFVEAARLAPDVEFALVGRWEDGSVEELRRAAGPNVTLAGWVDQQQLEDWYRRSGVYVQASLHEGFGMSVAEAMLAGSVPVVTAAGALPEVVGDAGVTIDAPEPAAIARGVERALSLGPGAREAARARVLERFSLESRCRAVNDVVDEALAAGGRG